MYLTPYQKKQLKIVIILVFAIPITVFAGYRAVQWFTGASGEAKPQNIIIGNITSSSVTVSWTTDTKVTGAVVPILDDRELEIFYDKRDTSRRNTHIVELKRLEPSTRYDLKIFSGEQEYAGTPEERLTVTTANVGEQSGSSTPVNGNIENVGDDVIIYVLSKDKSTYPVITNTSSTGNWLLDLSLLKKIADKSNYPITDSSNLRILAVSGVGNAGVVEGEYGTIFDSNGKLNQSLISTGGPYDSYFPEEAKILLDSGGGIGGEDDDDEDDEENNDDEPYTPPVVDDDDEVEDDDDGDERVYQLRHDLEWTDMVSADGVNVDEPEQYGEESVVITNLTEDSFTAMWFSQEPEIGYAMYGTTQSSLSDRARDERDGIATEGVYTLHSVEFTSLLPETTYYFNLYSGEEVYDNSGSDYQITTPATQASAPPFEAISGNIGVENTQSVAVVARIVDNDGVGSPGSSLPISTLVDNEGGWILTVGEARTEQGDYFTKSDSDIIEFSPKYLVSLPSTSMTLGEATTSEVTLSAEEESGLRFVKIPLLEEYGILKD